MHPLQGGGEEFRPDLKNREEFDGGLHKKRKGKRKKGGKGKKGEKRKKGKRGRKEKRRVIVLKGENYLKFVSLLYIYHGKQTKYISLLKQ